jgi:Fe-S-cluster containining protein
MNPYGVDTTDGNIRGPIVSLGILYDEMPETQGCERCQEVNGDDAIWCCRTLNPSMYYIEFLKIWEKVEDWGKEKRLELILRSIKNHLTTGLAKGCVFWDDECLVYEDRPFACRMYAVIPQESWDARLESLKKRYGEDYEPKPQCDLVSVKNGELITKDQERKWFLHTARCETRIGVPPQIVKAHDNPQGSYRTFHDHILLELFDEGFLTKLSELRLQNPSMEEIDQFLEVLGDQLRQNECQTRIKSSV